MSETTKYMLDYDGLKVIANNVVKNCVPLTGFDAKINTRYTVHGDETSW